MDISLTQAHKRRYTMKEEISRVYKGLQHLEGLPPTKNNLAIVLDALQVLEMVYNSIQEEVKFDAAESDPE